MKIIRLFLCLLLMGSFLLPLHALAEDFSIAKAPKGRIRYQLPPGIQLAKEASLQDGRLSLVIDTKDTNWETVITSTTDANRIEFSIWIDVPDSAASYTQVNANTSLEYDEESNEDFDTFVLSDLRNTAKNEIIPDHFSNSDYRNGVRIAQYDVLSSSVVPFVRDGYYAHLVVWKSETGILNCEYLLIDVRFTDTSARKVELATVPANRITSHQDTDLTSVISDGAVSYELAYPHNLGSLNTTITAPTGATHYAFLGKKGEAARYPVQNSVISISTGTGSDGNVDQSAHTLLWYDNKDAEKPFLAERLLISLTVGNPQPYPRYLREAGILSSVPQSRLIVPLHLSNPKANSDFIHRSYQDDTYRITINPGMIPEDVDLDNCAYEIMIAAPDDAVAYTTSGDSSSNIYGSDTSRYNNADSDLSELENLARDFQMLNGRRVVQLSSPMLATSRSFSHDPDLKLYTPVSVTGEYAGSIKYIYWYREGENTPFLKEYLIIQTDPFSMTTTQKALTDESQLPTPANMLLPIIILDEEDAHVNTGTTLYLAIENHVYAGKNCVVYGLHVQDETGRKIELKKDATIVLPYPKGMGMGSPGSYTLNHYDDEKGLIRYSEDSTDPKYRLTRIPHGITFKNQTFSPFVLSWEEVDIPSEATINSLPKTGDSSVHPLFLTGLMSLCAAALVLLKKARA